MRNNDKMDILWVGRFIMTKQLGLALRIMEQLKSYPNIHLHVFGTGNDAENEYYRAMSKELCVDEKVTFYGKVSHDQVIRQMKSADMFVFTSIMEATSSVILEAIGCSLPIVCFDTCGFGPIVTNEIGRKIAVSNPSESVKDFKNAILELYFQPELLKEMSDNCIGKCKTLTWEFKAGQMVEIYSKVVASASNVSSRL